MERKGEWEVQSPRQKGGDGGVAGSPCNRGVGRGGHKGVERKEALLCARSLVYTSSEVRDLPGYFDVYLKNNHQS